MCGNNDQNSSETEFLKEVIAKCEDIDDLRLSIFPMIKSQQEQWKEEINGIISRNGYTKSAFSDMCDVSRVSVDKWSKGAIPKNRETFLRIGMAAHYDLDQMNRLLQRYGRYPALYSKSLEDCVCIYVISTCPGDDALVRYKSILERIKQNMASRVAQADRDINTVILDDRLKNVQDEKELERFISDNSDFFSSAYKRFYAYVNMCIEANYHGLADSVFELAEGQGWSSSLRQCVSAIRQKKWFPTRNKIISLGIHLSMDHDQINEMLELAHMEPLCAKNIFESVIMFILDDASLNNMMDKHLEGYDPDELCRYARNVMEKLDIPEIETFISELPENDDE